VLELPPKSSLLVHDRYNSIFELETVAEMALNRERIQSIEDRLTTVDGPEGRLEKIEQTLGIRPATKHHWWPTTLLGWANLVASVLAILGIIVGTVSYVASLAVDKHIQNALKPVNTNIRSISGDIRAIKATLDAWKPFIAPEVIKNSTSLNREDFEHSLPRLNAAMRELTSVKASISPQTVSGIAEKLRATPESSPDYWPTVLQFIQLASASIVPATDLPPPNAPYTEMRSIYCQGSGRCMVASYKNILLDGGNIPNSVFEHCRIKFTTHPVGLKGVQFIDCVFEMPTSETPSQYLKKSAQTLLASNLNQVTFSEWGGER
jgi:hypothetical protein